MLRTVCWACRSKKGLMRKGLLCRMPSLLATTRVKTTDPRPPVKDHLSETTCQGPWHRNAAGGQLMPTRSLTVQHVVRRHRGKSHG